MPVCELVTYLRKYHLPKDPLNPLARHSIRVAFGHAPSNQSSDQCIVTLVRLYKDYKGVTELQLLHELMRQSGRTVPLAYPSEDRPDFIILPNGEMLWEAPKPEVLCAKCGEGVVDDPE